MRVRVLVVAWLAACGSGEAMAPVSVAPPPAASGPTAAERAAEAAARALAQEAAEAEAAAEQTAAARRSAGPQVQILRGRGTSSGTSALTSTASKAALYAGARWLQGRADGRGLEVVVFWETWCGYCREELPKLQALSTRVRSVDVVGLTTLSKGSDEATARRFLSGAGIRFPIAVVPESTKDRAGVRGVPHAVVTRDGARLWAGHPASLSEAQLTRWSRGG